jgi:hypothetical protein
MAYKTKDIDSKTITLIRGNLLDITSAGNSSKITIEDGFDKRTFSFPYGFSRDESLVLKNQYVKYSSVLSKDSSTHRLEITDGSFKGFIAREYN